MSTLANWDCSQIEEAFRFAERSTLKTYQTGAVIFDKRGNVVSTGWAHYNEITTSRYGYPRSVHAELHALVRTNKINITGSIMAIAMKKRKSGNRGNAKPCALCEHLLKESGIEFVIYSTPHALEVLKLV